MSQQSLADDERGAKRARLVLSTSAADDGATAHIDELRWLRARNRGFQGMSRAEEGGPERPFFFVQMADTQLGLAKNRGADRGWEEEVALCHRAAEEVNRLRPAFAIVCGDLIDEMPIEERFDKRTRNQRNRERRFRQKRDFKEAMSRIHKDIPLICLCGNHDVGDRPNAATLLDYQRTFGDDYFSFWCRGVRCLVVNSQLWVDKRDAPEEAAAQDRWLDEQLDEQLVELPNCHDTAHATELPIDDEDSPSVGCGAAAPLRHRTLLFSHVPPFICSPEERDGYFNLEKVFRQGLLKRLRECGTVAWFSGHYHGNAGGFYRHPDGTELEVVVTGAVGAQIFRRPSAIGHVPEGVSQDELDAKGDLLGLSGLDFSEGCPANESVSGLRIVRVLEDGVHHEWRTFSELRQLSLEELALPS